MTPPPPRAPGAIRRRALLTWTTALAGGLAFGAAGSRAADLPALAAASKPSVVAVCTYNALDSPRFTFRGTGFVVADGSQVVTIALLRDTALVATKSGGLFAVKAD